MHLAITTSVSIILTSLFFLWFVSYLQNNRQPNYIDVTEMYVETPGECWGYAINCTGSVAEYNPEQDAFTSPSFVPYKGINPEGYLENEPKLPDTTYILGEDIAIIKGHHVLLN